MNQRSVDFVFLFSVFLNIVLLAVALYFYYYHASLQSPLPLTEPLEKELPLNRYAYDVLKKEEFTPEEMEFGDVLTENEEFVTRMFYYEVDGKKVSGLAHMPLDEGDYPVIVMLRGFVDLSIYEPGIGTRRAAEVFARNGYITLAPDFLGYGESDQPSAVPLEDRFQTYPTVLQLLANIEELDGADEDHIGIWAHSNGGQIALTILELTGKPYPTVLWAPVSKPFPYSVLYFTDEFDDHGRYLRRIIAQFEEDYDILRYSLVHYVDQITAPVQLHQGGRDDAVPLEWSTELEQLLDDHDIEVEYFIYPDADHNLQPDWTSTVTRSREFYDSYLKK